MMFRSPSLEHELFAAKRRSGRAVPSGATCNACLSSRFDASRIRSGATVVTGTTNITHLWSICRCRSTSRRRTCALDTFCRRSSRPARAPCTIRRRSCHGIALQTHTGRRACRCSHRRPSEGRARLFRGGGRQSTSMSRHRYSVGRPRRDPFPRARGCSVRGTTPRASRRRRWLTRRISIRPRRPRAHPVRFGAAPGGTACPFASRPPVPSRDFPGQSRSRVVTSVSIRDRNRTPFVFSERLVKKNPPGSGTSFNILNLPIGFLHRKHRLDDNTRS